MTETWYVMEDGSLGDPRQIAEDASGVLRHRDGRAVAYGMYGPRSRGGVDAEAERAQADANASNKQGHGAISETETVPSDKQTQRDKAAGARPRKYKTRESKAE